MLTVADHPALRAVCFATDFGRTLSACDEASAVAARAAWLSHEAAAPAASRQNREDLRPSIRDLLRHGGYKPTGRGKPASEYLVKAALAEKLGPINAAVDACNAVSLHSGFPISVIDLDRAHAPFSIDIAASESPYVFNASGQTIALGGLLCVFDADGPCANPVKDSQRTKTTPDTTRTLSVVWGCVEFEPELARAVEWYRELLAAAGATTTVWHDGAT